MATKSPNTDNHRAPKNNCWSCDNYPGSSVNCCCKEHSRAAAKDRLRRELDTGEHDCCMFGMIGHLGLCSHEILSRSSSEDSV